MVKRVVTEMHFQNFNPARTVSMVAPANTSDAGLPAADIAVHWEHGGIKNLVPRRVILERLPNNTLSVAHSKYSWYRSKLALQSGSKADSMKEEIFIDVDDPLTGVRV